MWIIQQAQKTHDDGTKTQSLQLTLTFIIHIGKVIYSKIAGNNSVEPSAKPLQDNAVFKFASATKLITSIALLQCIDKGLIGLDEPLDKVAPELGQQIIKGIFSTGDLIIEHTKSKITARHLLTHTSGLVYFFMHPWLMAWKKTSEGLKYANSTKVDEKCNNPLVFEPGKGWAYGVSLDWAGVIVKRLHGDISLEDYMIEHIWKPVGRTAPFPTFCISKDEGYKSRLMGGAVRGDHGCLKPYEFWQGDNPHDQDGGHGLSGTADDWLAVLADLISDTPKLLSPHTRDLMFEPQIKADSPAMPMLLQLRPAWELVTGPVPDSAINHGLGGVLATHDALENGRSITELGWGGAANTVWFMSRDTGTAGFFSTQLHPFSDPAVKELVQAWKKNLYASLL
jgi:CubicO group peptidase (beta-lactamase class C family)